MLQAKSSPLPVLFLITLSLLYLPASSQNFTDIFLGNLKQDEGVIFSSESMGDLLGYSGSSAGDFNGDGFPDIIIGAASASVHKGEVYVLFGSKKAVSNLTVSSGVNPSQGLVISGTKFQDQFGYSVSYAGDVNDDKIDDIIVGAISSELGKGSAYVIYGTKNPPARINLTQGLDPSQGFAIYGANVYDWLGKSVSWAGDVNNDKIDDVIVGAYGVENAKGAAYVIFGKKGTRGDINLTSSGLSSSEGFVILGSEEKDFFGYSVSSAGDLDGDGVGDIIIGATEKENETGAAYIIYGKMKGNAFATKIDLSQGLSPSEGFMIRGNSTPSKFGWSVSSAGDFNGDGFDDVVIGAPCENLMAGGAYVIFGGERNLLKDTNLSSGLDIKRGVRISNFGSDDIVGYQARGLGDINNDDLDDIILTAPQAMNQTGMAYVIFGSKNFGNSEVELSNGLGSKEGFRIIGVNPHDYFGVSASGVGDMNGDGLNDIIIGAHGINGQAGAVYLLFSPRVCPKNCETCDEDTFSRCLVCEAGYGLHEDRCVEKCPSLTELRNGVCHSRTIEFVKGLFDSGAAVSRVFTMGRSMSVGLGLMAKIIQNVRYLNISYPQETLDAFESYGTDLFELPIPGVFYKPPETKELPIQYSRYDTSPTFLENYWQTMMSILITLGCLLAIRLVQYLTRKQDQESLHQAALKNMGQTAINLFIIQIYSNLDDVIFFFLLDAGSTKLYSASAEVSLGVAAFFLTIGLFLVFFHCWVLGRYQQAKKQNKLEKFQEKFSAVGTLFEDFKDESAVKQSFFGVLILRCVFMVLVIMLLQPPWVQAVLLMLINLMFLSYFIHQRPFKSLFDEVSQYFCEFTIFVAYLSVLILSVLDERQEGTVNVREGFGRCIVISGIVLSLGGFIIQVIQIVGAIYGMWKFFKEYKKKESCGDSKVSISVVLSHNRSQISDISQIERSRILNKNGLNISSLNTESALIQERENFVIPLKNKRLALEPVRIEILPQENLFERNLHLAGEHDILRSQINGSERRRKKRFNIRPRLPHDNQM